MAEYLRLGVVSFAFGAALLLIALLGGGIEIKEIRVGHFGTRARAFLGGVGSCFIALGIWVTSWEGPDDGLLADAEPGPAPGPSSTEMLPSETPPSDPGPTETTSVTDEPFPDGAEKALLGRIPADLRSRCVRGEWPEFRGDPAVYVQCFPRGGADVSWYGEFESPSVADEVYSQALVEVGVSRDESGGCGGDITRGENRTQVDGEIVGRHMCFSDHQGAWMEWVRYGDLYAIAQRADGSSDKLFEWWVSAGPR